MKKELKVPGGLNYALEYQDGNHPCSFADQLEGFRAIVRGVKDAIDGYIVTFIIKEHSKTPYNGENIGDNSYKPYPPTFVTIGRGGSVRAIRYVGSELDPDGSGSSSLIMSGLDYTFDIANLVGALSAQIYSTHISGKYSHPVVFRSLNDYPDFRGEMANSLPASVKGSIEMAKTIGKAFGV